MIREFLQGKSIHIPLHALMVHIPIGLWVASFILDTIYLLDGSHPVAAASYYCILIGLIGAGLAIITGLADRARIPKDVQIPKNAHLRRMTAIHMTINMVVTSLYLINLFSRYAIGQRIAENMLEPVPPIVTGGQFILSIFSIILLGMSSYIGSLLTYRYGIGLNLEPPKEELKKEQKVDKKLERTRKAA